MTLAVDFDGVIHAYSLGWADGTIYDPPLPGALDGLRALLDQDPVFIHTTREPEQVAEWLTGHGFVCRTEHDGPFWNIRGELLVTNRKLAATAYLDDRAVRFGDWDQALAELLPETGTGNLRIHESAVGLIDELPGYSWGDEAAAPVMTSEQDAPETDLGDEKGCPEQPSPEDLNPALPVVPDPRQPAYDAVYEYIRGLGPYLPPDPRHRNAIIWRAVHAALDATPTGRCISSHCVEGDHILPVNEPA